MRAFARFALAMFLSMAVAQIVAQQLAVRFGAREEFILVMVVVGSFAVVSIAVISIAFIAGSGLYPIDLAAMILAALAVIPTAGGMIYGMSQNSWNAPTLYDFQIVAEILIPALIAVLIQWILVRRYRREHEG
jgi:hypothetical protein